MTPPVSSGFSWRVPGAPAMDSSVWNTCSGSADCEPAPICVRDALAIWRDAQVHERRLKHSTVAEYLWVTARLRDAFGEMRVHELDVVAADRTLCSFAAGSRSSAFSVLSAALHWLDRTGHCRGITRALPETRPKSRRRFRSLSDAEYALFALALSLARSSRWARPVTIDLLAFLLVVPLRAAEAVSLHRSDVDLSSKTLWLTDTKVGDRVVPLTDGAVELIGGQSHTTGYVFRSRHGKRSIVTVSGLSHALKRIVRRFGKGLEDLNLHGLRHSWATKAIRDGASMEHVRRILGHSSEWMTSRYVHVGDTELKRVMQAVEDDLHRGLAIQQSLWSRGER